MNQTKLDKQKAYRQSDLYRASNLRWKIQNLDAKRAIYQKELEEVEIRSGARPKPAIKSSDLPPIIDDALLIKYYRDKGQGRQVFYRPTEDKAIQRWERYHELRGSDPLEKPKQLFDALPVNCNNPDPEEVQDAITKLSEEDKDLMVAMARQVDLLAEDDPDSDIIKESLDESISARPDLVAILQRRSLSFRRYADNDGKKAARESAWLQAEKLAPPEARSVQEFKPWQMLEADDFDVFQAMEFYYQVDAETPTEETKENFLNHRNQRPDLWELLKQKLGIVD